MPASENHSAEPVAVDTSADVIIRWLLMVAALVFVMVAVGGFVRLSRAGLSIVEWNVVAGVLPPIGDTAWVSSFGDYQQTPEYQLVNYGMSLGDYQRIFYIEWAHRLIARIAGLLVIIPLIWFLWTRRLTFRASLRYWAVAALFGLQGAIGWMMVSSGLNDRPVVSHFRLTIHLLAALVLFGTVLWMALDLIDARDTNHRSSERVGSSGTRVLAWTLLVVVFVQIAYGGLVAGLRAGHVSDTWPLMFGRLIPSNLLTVTEPWWSNLYEPLGAHWVHRWLAFLVAALAVSLFFVILRHRADVHALNVAANSLLIVVTTQIVMGIGVVVFGVPDWLALAHQANGVVIFGLSLVIVHGAGVRRSAQPTEVVSSSL
jgi:cytochrome c oxidase assembly protein subunit 15